MRKGRLPKDADTLYLHDIALCPSVRGQGAAREGLDLLVCVDIPHIGRKYAWVLGKTGRCADRLCIKGVAYLRCRGDVDAKGPVGPLARPWVKEYK